MAKTKAKAEETIVTTAVASRLLMITPARIGQLVADGWIQKKNRNGYELNSLVQGYLKFLKDEERRTSKTSADNRVREARAREIELRTAKQERELIELEEAFAALDTILGTVRAEVASIPARVTRDMTRRREIEQECDAALDRISTRLSEVTSTLRSGGTAVEAEPEDDTGPVGGHEPDLPADQR